VMAHRLRVPVKRTSLTVLSRFVKAGFTLLERRGKRCLTLREAPSLASIAKILLRKGLTINSFADAER